MAGLSETASSPMVFKRAAQEALLQSQGRAVHHLLLPFKGAVLAGSRLCRSVPEQPGTPQVNLFLRILRKRPDGYHDLASLFQAGALRLWSPRLQADVGRALSSLSCSGHQLRRPPDV